MTERILTVFDTPGAAAAAVRQLERSGVSRSEITVMSSEPIHIEGNRVPESNPTRITGYAIVGGLIGAAGALLLTIWPSQRVGIVTGGMPIVTPWAFGIIVFELTALGAIMGSLGRLIYEAGLGRRGALSDYDPRVSDGKVAVAIRCPNDESHKAAVKALAGMGCTVDDPSPRVQHE